MKPGLAYGCGAHSRARTGQRPGRQPGGAEASGHSSGNWGPEQQGRPDTYTCTAERLHAAERKGREMSGTGNSTSIAGGETPATGARAARGPGAKPWMRRARPRPGSRKAFQAAAQLQLEIAEPPELSLCTARAEGSPQGQLCVRVTV